MAGYGDDTGFAAWLTENGYTLPIGALAPAVLRQRGSSYIDGVYGLRFPGMPTDAEQDRAWPRTGAATYYGSSIAPDAIPVPVVEASYAAAYQEGISPGSLSVVVTAAAQIKREKVGPLETEYFAPGEGGALAGSTPMLSMVEGLLAPFLVAEDFPYPLVV